MRKNVLIVFVFSCLIQGIEAQVDSVKLKVSAVLKELSVEEKIDLLCARAPAFERLSMPAYDWWSKYQYMINESNGVKEKIFLYTETLEDLDDLI